MKLTATISLVLTASSIAHGATVLRESRPGGPGSTTFSTFNATDELSNDYQNPTSFLLMVGVNTLEFTIGGPANMSGGATNGSDGDFVFFDLPTGASVTSLRITQQVPGSHFFGAQFGNSFSVEPDATTNGAFQQSLDAAEVFGGIFRELTRTFPGDTVDQDFVGLFQETSGQRVNLTLEVTVVPEPSSAFLCFLGLFPLFNRRR